MQKQLVLVFNCGSSSIKFAIIDTISGANIFQGVVECIDSQDGVISWKTAGEKQKKSLPDVSYQEALDFILQLVRTEEELFSQISAVGHRVVHGGEQFVESVVIDDTVLEGIQACQNLAPLHNPANILGIKAAQKAFPELSQVAVFDTAFHQSMPKYSYLYALPYELYSKHQIRRYGFHGTSHRFVAAQAAEQLNKPLSECNFITAHLGNGCSLCAISNGKSVDTSMGLTPLAGLVMGTRAGDVDAGLHAHLVDSLGYDIHKVNELLNKESGLLGISGSDSDMRNLEAALDNGDERAALALEIFCYRLAKYIGSYAVVLGRIDALIFTGGIGENSSFVREKTMGWLKILGFILDSERNEKHVRGSAGLISTDASAKALVINTNEELMIAQDAISLTTEAQI